MQHNIPAAQLRAWLLTAVVPAILSVSGRNGWLTVLLLAVGCAALCFCVLSCRIDRFPKWLCVLEIAWLTVFLAGTAKIAGSCWENTNAPEAIPVILLLLAAYASCKGIYHSARTGATLLWLVLPILGIVFLTAMTDINVKWIAAQLEFPDGNLVALLLMPCATVFLPRESKALRWTGVILGAVAVAGTLLAYGAMGVDVSQSAPNSFYELSKGVMLLGVAERFEALVACALTCGLFAFLVLLLSAVHNLAEKIHLGAAKWSVWFCAGVAAGLMCILSNGSKWMAVGGVIFWGFLPVAAQVLGRRKNIEKK